MSDSCHKTAAAGRSKGRSGEALLADLTEANGLHVLGDLTPMAVVMCIRLNDRGVDACLIKML